MSTITKEELLKEFNLDKLSDEELEKVSGGGARSDREVCIYVADFKYEYCIEQVKKILGSFMNSN